MDTEQHDRDEDRVRRIARRQGYALHKDKAGVWSFNHQGGWQIVDAERNWLVAGERFDLSLDDVEQWLVDEREAARPELPHSSRSTVPKAGFFGAPR